MKTYEVTKKGGNARIDRPFTSRKSATSAGVWHFGAGNFTVSEACTADDARAKAAEDAARAEAEAAEKAWRADCGAR